MSGRYRLQVAGPAARVIAEQLPEAVAAAVVEFITGPLLEDPKRVGAPLRAPLSGLLAARRGTYRILYSVDVKRRTVTVKDVAHRSDSYRAP